MDHNYNIYLTGEFTEGTTPEVAIDAFARAAGISADKAQNLFDNAPSLIKKDVSESTATAYQAKLQSLGVLTRIEQAGTQAEPQQPPTEGINTFPTGKKRHTPFVFTGQGYEYFKIWIVNILLVIVTLGIYSPWAKVRNTQYFYGNTSLDGASFAFTADPVKMLIGRLIALGLFLLYAGINAMAPIAGALLGLGLIFVVPWVMNKSLAFYARNTTYRNIRFSFKGQYWPAFKVYILWPIAGVLSLMLLLPIAVYKQQEFVLNNHNYGNKSFSFSATIGDFYKMSLIALGLGIAGIVLGAGLAYMLPQLAVFGMVAGYLAAVIYFIVALNNLTFNNTSLADHDFKSNFEFVSFGWLMVSNFILAVLTLGIFIPWAKVRLAHYAAEHTAMDIHGDLDQFAAVSQEDPSAFGEEFGDVFDMA